MERKQLIFRKGIRYTIYGIYIISSIIGIGDYDALLHPECVKYQLIALLVNIMCFGMIYHHTNLFNSNARKWYYDDEEEEELK